MRKKHTILIAMLAALQLLTACGKPAPPQTSDTTTTPGAAGDTTVSVPAGETQDPGSATETTIPAETEPPAPEIAAIDGKQSEFRVLGRLSGSDQYYQQYAEFKAEQMNGDVMNDAVYERNMFLEEKYNVKIIGDEDTDTNVRKIAQANILANDATYDIYMLTTENSFKLAIEGLFYEIDEIQHVDLEKPWWQGEAMENLSIEDANYFLLGDITFSNFNATSSVFFNQQVASENNVANMYQLVREGKWTIEKMHEICLGITRDLDGDQDIDKEDLWGLIGSNFMWQPLFYGSGSKIVEKDQNDTPQLVWTSEKNLAIIDRVTKFLNDWNAVLLYNQKSDWKVNSLESFQSGHSLFFVEQLYGGGSLRKVEFEYGILPAPKYDEAQEEYTSYVHPKQSNAICIPNTNTRLELTGAILEDGAYQSYLTIRPAYYDVTLEGKIARNEDTLEMLDILFSNLNPDLAIAMSTAGLTIDTDMRSIYTNDYDQYISVIQKTAAANEKLLARAVEKYRDLKK